MAIEKMFEVATRSKMRFPFRGSQSVEELWDLSVQNLDIIFKTLNSEQKQVQEESLLDTKTKENTELEIKIQIVKHIVSVKLEEAASRQKAKEQKEQKQKLLEIIATKENESLQNKSLEELKEMVENIDKN